MKVSCFSLILHSLLNYKLHKVEVIIGKRIKDKLENHRIINYNKKFKNNERLLFKNKRLITYFNDSYFL